MSQRGEKQIDQLCLDRRLLMSCHLGVVVEVLPYVVEEIWFFFKVCHCLEKEKQSEICKVHFCGS